MSEKTKTNKFLIALCFVTCLCAAVMPRVTMAADTDMCCENIIRNYDPDCDGKIGLDVAIRALQILAGQTGFSITDAQGDIEDNLGSHYPVTNTNMRYGFGVDCAYPPCASDDDNKPDDSDNGNGQDDGNDNGQTPGCTDVGTPRVCTQPDGSTSVKITWDEVPGTTYYRIYRRVDSKDSGELLSAKDTGLITRRSYFYRVIAVNNNGEEIAISKEAGATPGSSVTVTTATRPTTTTTTTTLPQSSTTSTTIKTANLETDTNSVGMKFVKIPDADFWMQSTEVTRGQWKEVMDEEPNGKACDGGGENCPVEYVSGQDIEDFISNLNEKEDAEGEYRLPTDHEWEHAARAGSDTAFANGALTVGGTCDAKDPNLDKIGWYCANSGGKTHPVSRKSPNYWNLYDMHGNVWEVCQDEVMRGGSAERYAEKCTSAEQETFSTIATKLVGFRLVRIPEKAVKPATPIITASARDSKVVISWNKISNAKTYNIYWKKGSHPGSSDKKITGIEKDAVKYEVLPLLNNTTYYFKMTAENSAGESNLSGVKSATPKKSAVSIPSAPVNVWAVPPRGKEVTISWDKVGENITYNIYFSTKKGIKKSNYNYWTSGIMLEDVGESYSFSGLTGEKNYYAHNVTGLTNDTTYYFVVTAENSAGESSESGEVSAMPMEIVTFNCGTPLWMDFVRIPPGTFMMGSPEDEDGRDDGERLHQVTLTKPFYMKTMEVTQFEYENIMGDNPSWFWYLDSALAVEYVSLAEFDIPAFINKMNNRGEGKYRLPTEAEWEYACRAGSRTAFANGEITSLGRGYDEALDAVGFYAYNADVAPRSGGWKEPNAWGLYDMHGNIWEWCQDWYGDYPDVAVTDPIGPSSGLKRVVRGGSFRAKVEYCRSASRSDVSPMTVGMTIGFRLVLERNP
ncbi:SUMF1/EgtB/PvdO family nonheme iron enzyme [Desulfococcaceae bacterium HSG8]|nr:SUMF1/EgtB/PvdO family nonheme iron enzyme [Desulfococcaceae bacterium HSG8]